MKYGTESYKLVRSMDPVESHVAAGRVDSATWEEKVHAFVASRGRAGGTAKEALAYYHCAPYSTVTARFAALKRSGAIVPTGERREGSAVMIDASLVVGEDGQVGMLL
jgi:hypothetical protein